MKAFSLGRNESGEEAGGGGAWARLHSITRSIDVDYRQNTLVRQSPDDDERLCTCVCVCVCVCVYVCVYVFYTGADAWRDFAINEVVPPRIAIFISGENVAR